MIQPMSQYSANDLISNGLHQTALGKADAERSGHVSVCILLDPLQRLIRLILPSLVLDTLSLFPRTLYFPGFPPILLAGALLLGLFYFLVVPTSKHSSVPKLSLRSFLYMWDLN